MPVSHQALDVLGRQGFELPDPVAQHPQLGNTAQVDVTAIFLRLRGTLALAVRSQLDERLDCPEHAGFYGLLPYLRPDI